MRAGDVVTIDFGIPVGSEAGFRRPAVVVTSDLVLEAAPRTFHVVPLTTDVARGLPTEVRLDTGDLDRPSAAQCHLCALVSRERLVDDLGGRISSVELAQVRSVIADLLDIP